MSPKSTSRCPDCDATLNRRSFIQSTGAAAIVFGGATLGRPLAGAFAAPVQRVPETAVGRFYASLSPAQRAEICFPFDHASRSKISANWQVAKPLIHEDFYTDEQRQLISDIFRGVTSEEGHARFLKQMEDDDGGFDRYSVAVFGDPESERFEWELTGRHMTIRCDGDSVAGAAFGGPIVYGHGEEDPKDNLFHYQTEQANEVFQALSASQREQALLTNAPGEAQVQLQGAGGSFPGIAIEDLSSDQQQLVNSVIRVVLAPYRTDDIEETLSILKQGGGLAGLRMAFYRQGDLNGDQEWDIWRVEGPTFVCHFRGAPHVHAYLNVGIRQS